MTRTRICGGCCDRHRRHAVRRGPDRRGRAADPAGGRRRRPASSRSPPGCSATTGYIVRRRAGEVVRHLLLVPGRVRPGPAAVPPAHDRTSCCGTSSTWSTALPKFPEVPLDRTYAVLDDMERRYRAGGHSLQAVYKHRHRVARHVGDDDEAAATGTGCWHDHPARRTLRLRRLRPDRARSATSPTPGGTRRRWRWPSRCSPAGSTCTEQPQAILTALLRAVPAHRAAARRRGTRTGGRTAACAATWPTCGTSREHVEFCALTGNERARPGDRRAAPGLAGPAAVAGRRDGVRRRGGAGAAAAGGGRARRR